MSGAGWPLPTQLAVVDVVNINWAELQRVPYGYVPSILVCLKSQQKVFFKLDCPTMSAFSILLVALGACALARLLLPSFPRNDKSGSGLRHYPHTIPFLGLDLVIRIWVDFYRGQYSEGTRGRHVSCGRTFSARNLRTEYIYTIEPQNILTITKHRSSSFEKSDWASEAAKHIGNGILLNEGEAWSRSRKMLKPIFSSKVTDDPTVLEPHISRLIVQMKFLIETEGSFEFQRLADMFMLDVVTELLFGKSTCCLGFPRGPEGEEGVKFLMLVRSFDGPSASVMALGQSARISLLLSKRQLNETVAGMKAFFRRKLADIMSSTEYSSSRNTPWSVFRMMKAGGIPDEQVQAELQNIFFAGWDTTSVLLANTLYALLRHQNVQRRLREEIGALHGMPPTKQDLNRMQYLRFVLNEGMCTPLELLPPPPRNQQSVHNILVQTCMTYHALSFPTQSYLASCSSSPLLAGHLALAKSQSRHHPSTGRRPRRPNPHRCSGGDDYHLVHVLFES